MWCPLSYDLPLLIAGGRGFFFLGRGPFFARRAPDILPPYSLLFTPPPPENIHPKTEFKPETDEAWRLTVRQEVKSKAGLKQLGRSVLVFDFQPASTITASNSPSTPQRSTNAGGGGGRNMDGTAESMGSARETVAGAGRVGGEGGEGGEASRGGGAGRSTASDDDDDAAIAGSSSACCVVFVHDRVSQSVGKQVDFR